MEFCPICNNVYHKNDLETHIISHRHDFFVTSQLANYSTNVLKLLKVDIVPLAIELIKEGNRFTIENDCIYVERDIDDLILYPKQTTQLIKQLISEIMELESGIPQD